MSKSRSNPPANANTGPNAVPAFGMDITDEDEIQRRKWRGRTEIDEMHALYGRRGPFCDYRVASSSGSGYVVEVRSIEELRVP